MHTLLLSSVLSKEMYDRILLTTPYNNIPMKSPFVRMACVDNNRLPLTPDEKAVMPEIYLFQFEQTVKKGKSEQGTGVITHFLEIRINYNKAMGGSGYYSIPVEQTKTLIYELIIALVYTHIPALHPIPLEYANFAIALSDYVSFNQYKKYAHNLVQTPKSYPNALKFKLRRIDFSYDITTDYKNILLDLMSKGYRPRHFKDNAKVYYGKDANNETITESNYLKSKSVYINTYDKEKELQDRNAPLTPEDMDRVPYMLRFEVQAHKNRLQYMVKKERKTDSTFQRDLFSFLDNELEYNTLKYYMESLVGKGHYFYFDTALEIINNSAYSPYLKGKLCSVIRYISKYHSIHKFLELVENGTITDMGTLSTAKNYLKQIEFLDVNPICISDRQRKAMAAIKKEHPMPDLENYKYGEDFLYNPLVNLWHAFQITEQLKNEI